MAGVDWQSGGQYLSNTFSSKGSGAINDDRPASPLVGADEWEQPTGLLSIGDVVPAPMPLLSMNHFRICSECEQVWDSREPGGFTAEEMAVPCRPCRRLARIERALGITEPLDE